MEEFNFPFILIRDKPADDWDGGWPSRKNLHPHCLLRRQTCYLLHYEKKNHGAIGGIRTHTTGFLKPLTLPLVYDGIDCMVALCEFESQCPDSESGILSRWMTGLLVLPGGVGPPKNTLSGCPLKPFEFGSMVLSLGIGPKSDV